MLMKGSSSNASDLTNLRSGWDETLRYDIDEQTPLQNSETVWSLLLAEMTSPGHVDTYVYIFIYVSIPTCE